MPWCTNTPLHAQYVCMCLTKWFVLYGYSHSDESDPDPELGECGPGSKGYVGGTENSEAKGQPTCSDADDSGKFSNIKDCWCCGSSQLFPTAIVCEQ